MTRIPTQLEPPGEIIREELEARGWTQQDLADLMGRPLAAVNEMINAKRKITAKTANELEAALGVSAQFWLNLESSFQLSKAGSTSPNERARLMEYAPIREMQRRGWLPRASGATELRDAVYEFFGIGSLDERPKLAASFRQAHGEITTAHIAWCTWAMKKASAQRVGQYRASRANELRAQLRALAAHSEEVRRVPAVLADFGIRFVVVKHLRSTKTDGAVLWLSGGAPVIVLSLRYGRIDSFWHTLCHEVSHVVHRDSSDVDTDLGAIRAGEAPNTIEERANQEAAATLIPPAKLESFILRKRPYFSAKSIIQFANLIKIHPGIVVGQLQFRKAIKYTHSNRMLVQIRESILETSVSDGWVNTA